MSWVAVGGAAVGVIGSMASDSGGGGGGGQSQTATKEPWLAAQPWIMNNMTRGQALQNQYTDRPFNAQQTQAYQNQANQGQYMRALTPSLLGQIGSQQVGFDRNNPNYRPPAFNFDGNTGMGSGVSNMGMGASGGGLLSMLSQGNAVNSSIPEAKAPVTKDPGDFVQMGTYDRPIAGSIMRPGAEREMFMQNGGASSGAGYGDFRYGQALPEAGTKGYRDMQEYFLMGGRDPGEFYSRGAANPYGQAFSLGSSPGMPDQIPAGGA